MIKRYLYDDIFERIKEPRIFIIVITGPRQVGKTTMVNQVLNEISIPSMYVTADGVSKDDTFWISQQWEIARLKLINSGSNEFILAIDEIQKIYNWSEIVKKEWDSDNLKGINLKVVLLGSSQLFIQKGLTESLAGRVEPVFMPHWSFSEMQDAFDFTLQQYIWFGGYPGAAKLIKNEKRWKDYIVNSIIETTITKDVLMMARIDKPALLQRLFELGCLYSGQILSLTKILGQLQDSGNTTTLTNYLRLLDLAGMLTGLEKTYAENIRTRSSSPKFQVYNTGLMNSLRTEKFKDATMNPVLWGRIIETAVGAHLLNFSRKENYHLEYWRDRNAEVDFVLRKGNQMIGLEVKSNVVPKNTGMQLFLQKFKPSKVLMVGDGGFPIGEFLKINPVKLVE
jgi:uncharacterized protein